MFRVINTFVVALSLTSFVVSLPSNSHFQSKENGVCPGGFTGLLPHPSDCTLFYHCNDGHDNIKNCPSGLYFNPVTKSCDWPYNVPECVGGTKPPATTTTTTTTERPTPPETEICSPGVFGYQRFPESCSYYVACADGTAILKKCESGSSFDSKDSSCKDSNLVEGCGDEDPITTTTTPVPITRTTTEVTTKATTTTEDSATEGPTSTSRPTDATTTTRRTTVSTTTTTEAPVTTTRPTAPPGEYPCPAVDQIYMPHPDDCNRFYLCRNGHFISVNRCGVGLWFHYDDQICIRPWGSSCR